jgi:pimeloyl-ACP methyl ester carboxylesterase
LLTRRLLQQLILDPEDATDAQIQMLQAQFQVAGTTRALGKWLREFLLTDAAALNKDPLRYSTLTMPALLLWGQEDAITPLAQGQALLSVLPDAEMITLAGTGHIPAIENPRAFNRALLDFLTAHRPTPAAANSR